MQDQYTGAPGSFINDGDKGVRIPEQDWGLYQHNKAAYLADPQAATEAFNHRDKPVEIEAEAAIKKPAKTAASKPISTEENQ